MSTIQSNTTDERRNWFILNRLGLVLPKSISKESRRLFLDEFNKPESKYRNLLKEHFLADLPDLSLETLSEEAIQYLLLDLEREQEYDSFNIGAIATEQFVETRLFPLLTNKTEPFNSNLRNAIRIAGEKNNRRFII